MCKSKGNEPPLEATPLSFSTRTPFFFFKPRQNLNLAKICGPAVTCRFKHALFRRAPRAQGASRLRAGVLWVSQEKALSARHAMTVCVLHTSVSHTHAPHAGLISHAKTYGSMFFVRAIILYSPVIIRLNPIYPMQPSRISCNPAIIRWRKGAANCAASTPLDLRSNASLITSYRIPKPNILCALSDQLICSTPVVIRYNPV